MAKPQQAATEATLQAILVVVTGILKQLGGGGAPRPTPAPQPGKKK